MKFILTILFLSIAVICNSQVNRAQFHNANSVVINADIPAPTVKQRIYVNFSLTNLSATLGAKWNSLFGAPHSSVLSIAALKDTAGVTTSVGISTVATANWAPYSGSTSSTDNFSNVGIGTYYPVIQPTHNFYTSNFYNYGFVPGQYSVANPQFRVSGLDPAKTYSIYITCAELTGAFEAKGVFRAVGLTSPSAINVNGDVANQSLGATFTLQPTVGGIIDVWANVQPSGSPNPDIVTIPAILIIEQ